MTFASPANGATIAPTTDKPSLPVYHGKKEDNKKKFIEARNNPASASSEEIELYFPDYVGNKPYFYLLSYTESGFDLTMRYKDQSFFQFYIDFNNDNLMSFVTSNAVYSFPPDSRPQPYKNALEAIRFFLKDAEHRAGQPQAKAVRKIRNKLFNRINPPTGTDTGHPSFMELLGFNFEGDDPPAMLVIQGGFGSNNLTLNFSNQKTFTFDFASNTVILSGPTTTSTYNKRANPTEWRNAVLSMIKILKRAGNLTENLAWKQQISEYRYQLQQRIRR